LESIPGLHKRLKIRALFCLSRCVCSRAAFAVLGLVWSIAACAAPGRASSTAVYAVPGHICVSLLQYSSLYCPRRCLSPAAACASPGRICSTAACAVPEDGLKQLVVHLDCLSSKASAAPRRVCPQELSCAPEVSVDYIEPVLHLFLSVYKSFVQHLEVSVFKSLCCICAFLSTRALFCICACLQSTRVLCCTWTCLPTRVQWRLYLAEHSLQKIFVCFVFFRNRYVGSFRFKPKIFFVCFEDTLLKSSPVTVTHRKPNLFVFYIILP
jgi:hypothetical protein